MCGCEHCPTGGIELKTLGHEHSLRICLAETQQISEKPSIRKVFGKKSANPG